MVRADAEAIIATLQRLADSFADDVVALQAGVAHGETPDDARHVMIAALRYVVDRFDLYPDHMKGMGFVDDAAIVRLAARQAVHHGATDPGLRRLADEVTALHPIFGDLFPPIEKLVDKLASESIRGRTPAEVVDSPKSRMALWQEVNRYLKSYRPQPPPTVDRLDVALRNFHELVHHGLLRAGVLEG